MIKNNIAQPTRVLVIEDNLIASKSAEMLFEAKGCIVDCVSTGKEAIDKINEHYDIILLDLGLPDMSGLEVAETIRNSKSNLTAARIVIVTAFDPHSKDNKEIINQLNICDCFSKPLTIKKCELILEY